MASPQRLNLRPKRQHLLQRFDVGRLDQMGVEARLGRAAAVRVLSEASHRDQAHLAREFRDLAGCPPSVLLAEEFRNVQAGLDGDWE